MAKPTIFIPGFPASTLRDATTKEQLFPPTSLGADIPAILAKLIKIPGVEAGPPILDTIPFFAPAASTLYAILAGHGISEANGNFIPIGWDWRQSVASDDTVGRIKTAVDTLTPKGKIVAVIHSTGGLVFRAFLQKNPDYIDRFEQVLAFAIPWLGTLEALHAVDKGTPIKIVFKTILSTEQSLELLTRCQAAYDLFPSDPPTSLYTLNGNPSSPLIDRSWLDPNRPYMPGHCDDAYPQTNAFPTLPVTNICGWGGPTWPQCDSDGNGNLTFGNPINEPGDGTVQFVSASSLQGGNVRSMFLPIGAFVDFATPKVHGQIWDPPIVGQLVNEVFDNAAKKPFVTAAVDSNDFVNQNATHPRVRVAATAADGSPLPNAKVTFGTGPLAQTVSLQGQKKIDLDLARGIFDQKPAPTIARTVVTVSWDGGQPVKIPIAIMTS